MKVKELNNVCAITVGRRYFDRLTGELIHYNKMNRRERMAFIERTVYLIHPSDGDNKGFDVYLY